MSYQPENTKLTPEVINAWLSQNPVYIPKAGTTEFSALSKNLVKDLEDSGYKVQALTSAIRRTNEPR